MTRFLPLSRTRLSSKRHPSVRVLFAPLPLVLAIAPFAASCQSGAGQMEASIKGKTVYGRTCQHAELKGTHFKAASTNYVGLPDKFPAGSEYTVLEVDGKTFVLGDKRTGKELRIDFVEKHNRLSAPEWFNENFSLSPVKLPANLSPLERKNVSACTGSEGMSRDALFLALGHPPASLSPDRKGPVLVYQWKRFNKIQYALDQNKVTDVRD